MKKSVLKFFVSVVAFAAVVLCTASFETKAADESVDEIITKAAEKVKEAKSITFWVEKKVDVLLEKMDSYSYVEKEEGFVSSDDVNSVAILFCDDGTNQFYEYVVMDGENNYLKASIQEGISVRPYSEVEKLVGSDKRLIYDTLATLKNAKIKKETKNYYVVTGKRADNVLVDKATYTISKKDFSISKVEFTINETSGTFTNIDVDYKMVDGIIKISNICYGTEKKKIPEGFIK